MATMGDKFSVYDDINAMINNNSVTMGDNHTIISDIHVTDSM